MTLTVEELPHNDAEQWNRLAATFDFSHPLNAYGWGRVREVDGWKPSYLIVRGHAPGEARGLFMVLTKKIPWTGLSIMYAQKGPLCDPHDEETLSLVVSHVRKMARENGSIFLRIDPNLHEEFYTDGDDIFVSHGFIHLDHRWSFWNSPRDVYRIDLTKADDTEALLNTITRDARRCVRKAAKEGVTIRSAETLDELKSFYTVFSHFTVNKGFMCRQYRYQEALWNEFVSKGDGRLFLCMYQGEIIGGLICLMFGGKCLAMHMGTPPQYNRLQTYYAYVWESIRWAKERGCRWYSFRGVGTTPSQEFFKRKFGPEVVPLVGYYDLPLRPVLYRAFYSLEFVILPRVWRTLMKVRKAYKSIGSGVKRLTRSAKN
jgi:lipid II:glycine glycyltransferase (peptidoglycan interpeptide bridge formation enzyme)